MRSEPHSARAPLSAAPFRCHPAAVQWKEAKAWLVARIGRSSGRTIIDILNEFLAKDSPFLFKKIQTIRSWRRLLKIPPKNKESTYLKWHMQLNTAYRQAS